MKFAYACPGVVATLLLASAIVTFAGLNDGLVLYYSFDSAPTGGIIADQSGRGNNGIVHDNPILTAGQVGGAYQFDATNDYIQVPPDASLDVGTQLTFAVWFNAFGRDTGRIILSYCDPLGGWLWNFGAHVMYNAHGGAWVGTGANLNEHANLPGSAHIISVTDPSTNEWHHLVVTYAASDGVGKLYLDGAPVLTMNMGAFRAGTTSDLFVAYGPSLPGDMWRGMLDELRIYNRVIGADEVEALYKGWSSTDPPYIALIGFSDQPDGDQDVTEFYTNETLYVRVRDVDVVPGDPACRIKVILKQARAGKVEFRLTRNADGSFTGSCPLNVFRPGKIRIDVEGSCSGRDAWLMKRSSLQLNAN